MLSQIKQLIEEKIKVETENFGLHAEIEWIVRRAQGLDTLKVKVSPLENNFLEATQVNQACAEENQKLLTEKVNTAPQETQLETDICVGR